MATFQSFKSLKLALCAFTLSILSISCGKDANPFGAPLIKPPVDEATPAAFKPSTALKLQSETAQGVILPGTIPAEVLALSLPERMKRAMTKEQGSINGGANCFGLIGCSLDALDYRINEVNTRTAEGGEYKCTTSAPVDFKYEALGASMTMRVQCHDIFADNGVHGEGSGLIFGKDGSLFSVGMALNQGTTGKFQYQAIYDQDANVVTYLEHSYWEDSGSEGGRRVTATNLKANRSTKAFELTYVSNGDATGFGCGSHIKSDGNHILYQGAVPTAAGMTCAEASFTEGCLDATSFAAVSGSCSVSASDFELADAVFPADAPAAIEELKGTMGSQHFDGHGTAFKN
jgi:hypothetical protein